jgi:hypothetical protein
MKKVEEKKFVVMKKVEEKKFVVLWGEGWGDARKCEGPMSQGNAEKRIQDLLNNGDYDGEDVSKDDITVLEITREVEFAQGGITLKL